ncbi:MAG: NAD(P)H-dependent oxidoreductase subunit E [Deltaproteobacteria bacterium]|nr:NAD(P)H-dependent oxidoreductase subunit E [Deltaproteobacteria bacterium]
MPTDLAVFIQDRAREHGGDRTRLLDVVRAVQEAFGHVSSEAMDLVAQALSVRRVEVEGVVSYYAFLSREPKGQVVIRLSDCPSCRIHGMEAVGAAFEEALGIRFGGTTPDGRITLEHTPCIGLCDQGPAALVNEVPITRLTPGKAREVSRLLVAGRTPWDLAPKARDTADPVARVHALVDSNIRKEGLVVFAPMPPGQAVRKALAGTPEAVIEEVKASRLCGRGGAGFPAGLKWEFARKAPGDAKYVICNADEGEPGTFKDRVILTENPDLVFEGMTLAAYAIGAAEGIVYLRAEYEYLRAHLEAVLARRRTEGLLGRAVAGRAGFDFDIRIQVGAGAYICGEESALIESAEGKRGVPRNRPPFPVTVGYLDKPTSVNNVETFCCAARVVDTGASCFSCVGSIRSTGTKLLSVSGDVARPGIYEVQFGQSIREFLEMVGGEDAIAVQVGGPSGTCIGPAEFERHIAFEDLATGGSMMVFGPGRDMVQVAAWFMDFFVHESCGWCTPCRVGNVLIRERVQRILAGRGVPADVAYLETLCTTVKKMSRCGLGQTSPNPVVFGLKNFRPAWEAHLGPDDGLNPAFDMDAALADAVRIAGREPVHP